MKVRLLEWYAAGGLAGSGGPFTVSEDVFDGDYEIIISAAGTYNVYWNQGGPSRRLIVDRAENLKVARSAAQLDFELRIGQFLE